MGTSLNNYHWRGRLLPTSNTVESFKVKDGEVVSREILVDSQEIDFKGAKISIMRNDAKNRTHIIAEEREGFKPPARRKLASRCGRFCHCLSSPRATTTWPEKIFQD
jgi:hypothetical protein